MDCHTGGGNRVDDEKRALDHVPVQIRDIQNSGLVGIHVGHVAAIGETANDVVESRSMSAETEEEENKGEDKLHFDGYAVRTREFVEGAVSKGVQCLQLGEGFTCGSWSGRWLRVEDDVMM